MSGAVIVRRVLLHEWQQVRSLRLDAVRDPNAAIAFLTTPEQELARDEAFWRERTAGGALSENAAQFVAIDGDHWVGTATVLLRASETRDHHGREVTTPRADVVGVYLAPTHRGQGVLAKLLDGASAWAGARGADALTLDVHTANARAQRAYRAAGFVPTGVTFTSSIGPELEMRRTIALSED